MKESISDRYKRVFGSQPVKLFLGDEELCRNILTCLNDDTGGLASRSTIEGDFAIVNTHVLASVLSQQFAKEIGALPIVMPANPLKDGSATG